MSKPSGSKRVGRPKVPLIDRETVVATALDIIDREGIDALSIRRLGAELGVNGASLYHHFKDKDDILYGVRMLILQEGRVLLPRSKTATWQDYLVRSVARYRTALFNHPNAAPLMTPARVRPVDYAGHDRVIGLMLEDGVPARYCYAIIDSFETLAFGSAMRNPHQLSPRESVQLSPADQLPHLERALRSARRASGSLFELELQALLAGWNALIDQERPHP